MILQPGGSVIWGTVLEGPLTFEARPTARALVFTNFRLLVSLAVAWAWDAPSEEILQAADRIAARMVGIVERSGRLVVELRDPFPDWGVVAREFAGLLSDPDMLEAFLELLTQEDVLDRAGVFATSEALRTLLQVPAVAGQIRTALDLVVGAVGGGVDALITFAPPGPVPASVTEENARVIFLRWGTLWAADLKGRDATPLSPLDQEAAFVGLAQRNGAPILYYLAGGPGRPALRARNLSSGETFELPARLPRGARYLYASSSPGGRYVALTFGDYERYSRVELLDLGTGDQRRVLTSACLYPGLNCPAYGPARWSPDGRLLLVNADYEDASGAVLADPFTAQRSEIGGFAGHGSWSPDGRAVCGYWADAEFGPESALIVGEAPDWAYRTLLERRAGEGLRAVWDCVWLDQSRIAFVSRDYDPQTHEPVDEAVSLYDLRSDEVEPVAHLGGEPVSELFAVPGLGVLAFNRWEGRPGLLQLSDGKVTSILQSGDQIVAITQVPIPLAPNTTADIWGPDAVVNRPHPDLYWCDVPDGCAEVLRRHGESARAIAYLRATDGFILIDFRELGRIDYGVQYLAPGANWAGFVLLNGDPSVIDGCAIAPEFDTLRRTDPRYRRLYGDLRERYEQVIPICDVGPGAGLEHSEPLADGGQRLVLRIPIMTCHACEVVGYLRWAVTFDTQGRLARTEVLEPGRGP
ncbi:MAG TPA: hypothetical protein VNO17_04870 [Actinomycetota bacterium]|nr:hypothetical protein [Actinomycetota bacterium]